jgi:phosphoserine phosphatase
MNSMLYIVYGIGNDSVGLVGAITAPISKAGGNIVDMRQDVLHGLFTIYLVVDLGKAAVSVEEFSRLVEKISAETGLKLAIDKYTPSPRGAEKKNILLTLVGEDKPGIIATISEKLGRYNINIETSDVVARENIFLMDLLCDVSKGVLPVNNLKSVIREIMLTVRINTMFQTEDVFNKKKKIVLFDMQGSFIDAQVLTEIMQQAKIAKEEILRKPEESDISYVYATAASLENLPMSVIDTVVSSIEISRGTHELLQTLKIFGYKIGLISNGFTFFTNAIKSRLGIDYSFGYDLPADDDSQCIVGDLPPGSLKPLDRSKIIAGVIAQEKVELEDITFISDQDFENSETLGIRLIFDMKALLDLVNQHVLSRDSLKGLLRSFGVPKNA